MKKMPWVRFFASDWLAGTRGMSAVETGVYITLIATMYERGEPVQEDHARLSRLCGASNSAFKKALEALVGEGKITRVNDGLWNDRVEKEKVYLSEKSEVGLKAAKSRWSKKDNENNYEDDANALPLQCAGNANQKPDTRSHIVEATASYIAHEFEKDFWPIYPRKAGKGQALKAYRAARKLADAEIIVAGVKRYSTERTGQDPAFTRHASTWLNGQCWLDEAAPSAGRPAQRAPPPETAFQQRQREARESLRRGANGDFSDEPASHNGPTIDLERSGLRTQYALGLRN